MQAEITFLENAAGTRVADIVKIFQAIKPIKKFKRFVEESDWDKCLMGYEKYMNWFSYGVIIASAFFFIPVCISIFSR
ncbi:MAG: hypothetical protein WB290_12615 [Smithella sp.]